MKRAKLRGPILRAVSRSFYLSIRLLPAKLRDPIAVAYLLARATDTLADTVAIEVELREAELQRLARLIQDESLGSEMSFTRFAQRQSNPSERALLEAVPEVLAWLHRLSAVEQREIRDVLRHITEGQMLDLQRGEVQTAAELERYTYLVAGAVGEFWSKICALHLPNFATKPPAEMVRLGIAYGKGLQLINILRDLPADLAAGRSYLPDGAPAPWLARAEEGLAAGVEYSCALRSFRLRLATVLPALIGARTLALLRAAGPEIRQRKIKMPRSEVRAVLCKMLVTLAHPRAIRRSFRDLRNA